MIPYYRGFKGSIKKKNDSSFEISGVYSISDKNIQITEPWKIPEVFQWIFTQSDMSKEDMFRTYNCGIGMVIIVDKNTNKSKLLQEYQLIPMGEIIEREKEVIDYDKFF